MNESHQNMGFPITPESIAEKAEETHAQTQKLLSLPRPLAIRIGEFLGASFAYGTPAFGLLPTRIRKIAEDLGFRPICFVRSGVFPLLILSTPFWIGPEGFVRLECNRDGYFHLRTLMTNGVDVVVAKRRPESQSPLIFILTTDDFRQDYLALIQMVQKEADATAATPIYSADPLHLRAVVRAHNHLHRPIWAVVAFLCFYAIFLGAIAYLAYSAST